MGSRSRARSLWQATDINLAGQRGRQTRTFSRISGCRVPKVSIRAPRVPLDGIRRHRYTAIVPSAHAGAGSAAASRPPLRDMQTLGWGLPADARVQEACNVREVAAQRSQRLVRRMGGGHLGRQRWHYQAEAHDVSRHPAWTPTPRLDPESRFAPRRFSVVDFGCRSALRRGFKLARIWLRLIRPQNEGAGGVICRLGTPARACFGSGTNWASRRQYPVR